MNIDYRLASKMIPESGITVTPHHIPSVTGNVMEWSNNDEDFTVTLHMKEKEISGAYYEWCEASEDWIDGPEMSDADLISRIENGEFLAVELAN